ncbi:MAG TPA: Gfo/Idh/MocA family oxidoreductase [Bryobacteraceae bacterium]|nr:Gfo/Idh/MocA family oxidoreductase [Bryobacteraceae bacterium]
MNSRRKFIGTMATGFATTLASQSVFGSNERIRLGLIGAGARGMELLRWAAACPNVDVGAIADIYSKNLDAARQAAPVAQAYSDYRRLLDDKSIDAVLIATPPHLHCEHFVHSLEAGKHVYQERIMAFTLEHAKRMRAAHRGAPRLTVQVGHQSCSSGQMADAARFVSSGQVGKITAIHMRWFRNTPRGKPSWIRPVHPAMTAENVVWDAFLGEAPRCDFDADRYINWRIYSDYSGGSVHENLSQQLAFWYAALKLQVPEAVMMNGGVYLWKDGREVPDTMSVALQQREEMLITWDSGFGNNQLGVTEDVLGTDGTISRGQAIRYVPQKVNRPDGAELLGRTITPPHTHLQNFFDCIRLGREPNCGFETGYRVSIACRMALESYRLGRTVRWDAAREEMV